MTDPVTPAPIEDARAASPVAPRSRLLSRKAKGYLFVFGGLALVMMLVYLGRGKPEPTHKDTSRPLKYATPQPEAVPPAPKQVLPSSPSALPTTGSQFTMPPPPPPQQPQHKRKLLTVVENGAGSGQTASQRRQTADGDRQREESELGKALQPTVLRAVSATVMSHPDETIAAGRSIACVLDFAIDSQLPGIARCHVPYAITGEIGLEGQTGKVLLDRDTVITGEIHAGTNVRTGQNRIFIVWAQARTPHGVVIALNSPGTDSLGRSGVEGEVNNHWWARFGNALLFTMIDAGTQIISSELSKGGQTSINLNTAGQTAGDQFREDSRIPPTITVHEGETVAITVARDLDFHEVYGFNLKEVAR